MSGFELKAPVKFCEFFKLISRICGENLGNNQDTYFTAKICEKSNLWTTMILWRVLFCSDLTKKTGIRSSRFFLGVTWCNSLPIFLFIKNQISAWLCCLPVIWCSMFLTDHSRLICFYHSYFSIRCLTREIASAQCGRILIRTFRGVKSVKPAMRPLWACLRGHKENLISLARWRLLCVTSCYKCSFRPSFPLDIKILRQSRHFKQDSEEWRQCSD